MSFVMWVVRFVMIMFGALVAGYISEASTAEVVIMALIMNGPMDRLLEDKE